MSAADHAPVRYGQRVAHAALAQSGDVHDRLVLGLHALFCEDILDQREQLIRGDESEIEPHAPREYGRGELVDLGRAEHEHHVRGRFFQRFEQGVERAGGEHMHFVHDIDAVAAVLRGILNLFAQVADFVHAVIGSGVDFHDVQAVFRRQRQARLALPARVSVPWGQAVDRAGEYFRAGGLAVPRLPQNRYACATRPDAIWFFSVVTTASWPTTSANALGRHWR